MLLNIGTFDLRTISLFVKAFERARERLELAVLQMSKSLVIIQWLAVASISFVSALELHVFEHFKYNWINVTILVIDASARTILVIGHTILAIDNLAFGALNWVANHLLALLAL